MTLNLVDAPQTETVDDAAQGLDFDIEFAVMTQEMDAATPAWKSKWLCTPGCTSPGGGSFCSYCCVPI